MSRSINIFLQLLTSICFSLSAKIHYEGTLENGTKIASSRDLHQAPLQFQLGEHHVLEGLEVAVENMSVGQIVEATIPALYAYGHQGFPPKIPPCSTLIFCIELLEIIQQPMEERLQALRQT